MLALCSNSGMIDPTFSHFLTARNRTSSLQSPQCRPGLLPPDQGNTISGVIILYPVLPPDQDLQRRQPGQDDAGPGALLQQRQVIIPHPVTAIILFPVQGHQAPEQSRRVLGTLYTCSKHEANKTENLVLFPTLLTVTHIIRRNPIQLPIFV